MFTFLGAGPNYLFLGIFGPKFKFVCSGIDSNMQNLMAVFFASILGWKPPFWASLVQKMKIVYCS